MGAPNALRCWICEMQATAWDHVQPRSAGGSNAPDNLRPICTLCNSIKGRRWRGPDQIEALLNEVLRDRHTSVVRLAQLSALKRRGLRFTEKAESTLRFLESALSEAEQMRARLERLRHWEAFVAGTSSQNVVDAQFRSMQLFRDEEHWALVEAARVGRRAKAQQLSAAPLVKLL